MARVTQILRSADELAIISNPTRLSLLELLREPNSATGVSREMGIPRQQVNYHLHELERTGLIEFVSERLRGNCMEKLYRCTADSYVVSPGTFGELRAATANVANTGSSDYLVAIGAQLIDDVSQLREAGQEPIPILAIEAEVAFDSEADRACFAREAADAISHLAARYSLGATQKPFRAIFLLHPTTTESP